MPFDKRFEIVLAGLQFRKNGTAIPKKWDRNSEIK